MSLADPIIQELKHEASGTRKYLERVPQEHFGWRPHAKSMTLGLLASHLAETLQWVDPMLSRSEIDLDTSSYKPWTAATRKELLEAFDRNVAAAVKALEGCSDARLLEPWTFKVDGKTVFTMPRAAVIRSMVLNHSVHHRGQLSVYLRLKDVPLPQIYGPTGDDVPAGP